MLSALDLTGDGVFAVDEDERIIFWNRNAERILGYKAADVIGKHCFDVIAGDELPVHPICGANCDVLECARRGRAVSNYDVSTRTARGDARWLNVSIIVLTGRSKRSNLAVHLFRDVTSQHRAKLRTPPASASERSDVARLTPRETEVLQHLSAGLNNRQIAEALGTSTTTVRNHVEHVLSKLGVHSRLEAVVFAAQHRLV
jgi:PAS domain S-box-containing protein